MLRRGGILDVLLLRAAARRILDSESPAAVWLIGRRDDLLLAAVEMESVQRGISCHWHETTLEREGLANRVQVVVRSRRQWLRSVSPGVPRPLPQPKKPRVVFLPYTSRHIATLRPVVQALQARGTCEAVVVAASSDAAAALRKGKDSYVPFWAYEDLSSRAQLARAAADLAAHWGRIQQDETLHRCLADASGESVWPLLRLKMAEMFDTRPGRGAVFAERFLEAAHYVDLCRAMLSHLSPDLMVVLNESNVLGRAAVLVAGSAGVGSLHIQHGIMAFWMLWRKLYADHITVWGEADHRRLTSVGIPADRITVTGNPRFDHLANPVSHDSVSSLLGSMRLPVGGPIILTTTQNDSLEASRQQLAAVARAASAFPQYQVVVKLHPAERLEPYRRLLREISASHFRLVRDVDLHTLIAASAVLITRYSTTGLEAMLMKKPVITLNFSDQPDRLPYAESGAALGVHTPEDLLPALRSVLEHSGALDEMRQSQERFVSDYAFRVDGQATRRTVDLIERMVLP